MIINHNMGALNANRNMGINAGNASKSMEKLSSGLRINKAGDDAAGLAISEKMRGQIRGLDQASSNAQDGISMLQTAEGALGETHSILQRMRELSVQSSNDTNVTVDRTEIQKEMNQLASEVDRIANTTEFNTQKLLDGTKVGLKDKVDGKAVLQSNTSAAVTAVMGASGLDLISKSGTITITRVASLGGSADVDFSIGDPNLLGAVTIGTGGGTLTSTAFGGSELALTNIMNMKVGESITLTIGKMDAAKTDASKAISFQIGANSGQNILIGIDSMKATDLGIRNGVNALDVSTAAKATAAINSINTAIESVSAQRSQLGAFSNRLEHTIANLGTSSENLTSAESRIRDVDMAKEMSTFSKNNILSQAAQAMLSQANQQPQQVLQLLR
ncbi:flagellin [Clostridium tagluense]|uniref:flagellin N-terminal helical domain-containing protein n=1 Tax=Clostridium tagluense TaxID=360422 RepID=UPI001CF38498|nr:flagellin [Clostridium tagluense]MCB2310035.1 flagellin [Clostridium tagluense]MCB2314435.1 flagellin [Clostridium tagluense]MCB2319281.1 flagellin [Clostridium tagluense]MCB2324629.1 flagellin [Clostridium tagluense]MCB2329480.1 flagellin [Clostridium tagluense]